MKLLFLAPQPFFQERGTPIAVRLALNVIAKRGTEEAANSIKIDLLTYHEGEVVEIPGVTLHRISIPRFLARYVSGVGPGVSVKKLICDFFFLISAIKLVWRNRRQKYDLVHAVEEGVFVALLIKCFTGIPYIYDMDSSMALQVTEKWRLAKPLYPILRFLEKQAVKFSKAVAPVCDALCLIAEGHGARQTFMLRDISLIDPGSPTGDVDLRKESASSKDAVVILYVGNLEYYQGIDLLLEGFAASLETFSSAAKLIIVGGSKEHCELYRNKVAELGISERAVLLGPRPVSLLGDYIMQADILVSPRIKGNNTPMKIYSYLHSGKPILATRLPTHTQVLSDAISMLVEPDTKSFGEGLKKLILDSSLRTQIGAAGRKEADEKYTFATFSQELNRLYDKVDASVKIDGTARNIQKQVNYNR